MRWDTKLLGENTGRTRSTVNCTNVLLGQSPKAIETKAKINNWGQIKLKRFCMAKEMPQNEKAAYWMGKDICKVYIWKGVNTQIIQKLRKLNIKNAIKKWAEDLNRHFSKRDIQAANRQMERCSTWLVIRKMQVKTHNKILSHIYQNDYHERDKGALRTAGQSVHWCSPCGKQHTASSKTENRATIWSSNSASGYFLPKGNKNTNSKRYIKYIPQCSEQHYL